MGLRTKQFLILVWKNVLLQRRHLVILVLIILIPLLICLGLILSRNYGAVPRSIPGKSFPALSINQMWMDLQQLYKQPVQFAYSPQDCQLCDDQIQTYKFLPFDEIDTMNFTNVADSKELERILYDNPWKLLGGYQFDDEWSNYKFRHGIALNAHNVTTVVIRFYPTYRKMHWEDLLENDRLWYFNTARMHRNIYLHKDKTRNSTGDVSHYYDEGILNLIYMISHITSNYLDVSLSKAKEGKYIHLAVQRFSEIDYVEDVYLGVMKHLMPLLIFLAFMPFLNCLTYFIAMEKERGIKECLKLTKLPCGIYWFSYYVYAMLAQLLITILFLLIFHAHWLYKFSIALLPSTSWWIIFLLLMAYSFASTSMCVLVAVCSSCASTAVAIHMILGLLTILPYIYLNMQNVIIVPLIVIIAFCLSNNVGLGLSLNMIYALEVNQQKLNYENVFTYSQFDERCTVFLVFAMLVVDGWLYLLIALYVDAVWPGRFGIPKPWYFPFVCCQQTTSKVFLDDKLMTGVKYLENEPKDVKPIIKIYNLKKKYANHQTGLSNVSCKFYRGQTTAIIGANSSGKSTLLSILAGQLLPSSGIITIFNRDVSFHIRSSPISFGYCSEFNVLYDELNFTEHLALYGVLRGAKQFEVHEEIQYIMDKMNIDKYDAKMKSKTYNNTVKRQLSIATAFVGLPRFVILDEPTTGLDPATKIQVWELIHSFKYGRTIILSTHDMNEAELVADRVLMLKNGRIKACGSMKFLTNVFGISGFRLAVVKRPCCNAEEVTKFFRAFLPSIQLKREQNFALIYHVNEENTRNLGFLVRALDSARNRLCVEAFTVRRQNLNEIFLKASFTDNALKYTDKKYNFDNFLTYSCRSKFIALFYKHGLYTINEWHIILLKLFTPCIILLLFLSITSHPTAKSLPPLVLKENHFATNPTIFASNLLQRNHLMSKMGINVIAVDDDNDMDNQFLEWQKKDFAFTKNNILYGISGTGRVRTCWFNGITFLHTAALCVASLLYDVTVPNFTLHPIQYSYEINVYTAPKNMMDVILLTAAILWSLYILASLYIIFYCMELTSTFRKLQVFHEVHYVLYWFVAFICDYLVYLCIVALMIVTVLCFNQNFINEGKLIATIGFMLIIFGLPFLGLIYLFATIFRKKAVAMLLIFYHALTTGLIPFFVCIYFNYNLVFINKTAQMFILTILSPYITLAFGSYDVFKTKRDINACRYAVGQCQRLRQLSHDKCWETIMALNTTTNCEVDYDPNPISLVLLPIAAFIVAAIIYFAILLVIEYILSISFATFIIKSQIKEDAAVIEERQKIATMQDQDRKDYTIIMQDVSKSINRKEIISSISLTLQKGECIGLTGMSGSGKTMLLKIITSLTNINSGLIFINGVQHHHARTYNLNITPLEGSLPKYFTVYQMMLFFVLLCGYKCNRSKRVALQFAYFCEISHYLHLKIKNLNQVQYRKVANTIALIGNPQIVLFDEPTKGLDIRSKLFWLETISRLMDQNKSVIIATSDMQACDSLCTKICILLDGRMLTIGSPALLKSKFVDNILLTVKVRYTNNHKNNEEAVKQVQNFVCTKFINAWLKLEFLNTIQYEIANSNLYWPYVFDVMERAKSTLPIDTYFIEQESLQQVVTTINDRWMVQKSMSRK